MTRVAKNVKKEKPKSKKVKVSLGKAGNRTKYTEEINGSKIVKRTGKNRRDQRGISKEDIYGEEFLVRKPSRMQAAVEEEIREDLVVGRNAVMEALKGKITIESIYVGTTSKEGSIKAILALAKEKKVIIKEVEKRVLDSMTNGEVHQGILAKITPYRYCEVVDLLEIAKRREEDPFIIILDELEDPHNLGSIIRTAETCGVHGIIIPKRRNVGVTPTVYKSSVGAVNHIKIAKVTNINKAIDELKDAGIWIYGADIDGTEYSHEVNYSGPCAVIIGSEGRGISKLTLKKCDKLVKIPMIGKINSLNASVAGGIMMYEVLKGRLK